MMFKKKTLLIVVFVSCVLATYFSSFVLAADFTEGEKQLLKEHVYGGLPSDENIYVRKGYILCYNPETRTPNWTAYHLIPDYRKTPSRKGGMKRFRSDPDVSNEAQDKEYYGLLKSRGYARGHLAPYAAMGGDRDHDGQYAEYHKGEPDNVGDADDAETIYQANYMSNIAPQHHTGFNGWFDSGGKRTLGLWFELERWIQDDLVKEQGVEAWVYAGCIFGKGEHEKVGPNANIWVPAMFYKIVIMEDPDSEIPVVLAYLFPHQRVRHGELDDFLVSIDVIEALAGVDFFTEVDLEKDQVEWLESQDTWNFAQLHFTTEEEQPDSD